MWNVAVRTSAAARAACATLCSPLSFTTSASARAFRSAIATAYHRPRHLVSRRSRCWSRALVLMWIRRNVLAVLSAQQRKERATARRACERRACAVPSAT